MGAVNTLDSLAIIVQPVSQAQEQLQQLPTMEKLWDGFTDLSRRVGQLSRDLANEKGACLSLATSLANEMEACLSLAASLANEKGV